MTRWLTRAEAAKRVDRSERTIARWVERGHVREMLGRISEPQLLVADREMRQRRAHEGKTLVPRRQKRERMTAMDEREHFEYGYRLDDGTERWQEDFGRDGAWISADRDRSIAVIDIYDDEQAPAAIRRVLDAAGQRGVVLRRRVRVTTGDAEVV